jgi:hypothetical protein
LENKIERIGKENDDSKNEEGREFGKNKSE